MAWFQPACLLSKLNWGCDMAHPQETRDKLRKAFVFDQLSLEIAALQAGIGFGTARRWKADAKANGDDWDKVKAAHVLAGESTEDLGRAMLSALMLQYNAIMHEMQTAQMPAESKASLLASLADSFNKAISASKKILPETQEAAVAIRTVRLMAEFIGEKYPELMGDFAMMFDDFQAIIEREF